MTVFDERKAELERHEFMMGLERGRLAVALDLLTDSLIMVGQHGVYCTSSRNPNVPALDLQAVLSGMEGAKTLMAYLIVGEFINHLNKGNYEKIFVFSN